MMPEGERVSVDTLRLIIHKSYNQAVTEPEKLNDYEPFSPEVYGETSFDFILQMIEQIPITENDVFIDLGSGVGQVVLQVAALTKARMCIGIEKADVPASYAQGLEDAFKYWMNIHGGTYGNFKLIKGDFFDERFRELINNATFIFVNNFAFGPTVDHKLKTRFADIRDGVRILSSKSFCPLNFRITDRNLSDIGTIMHVREIQPHFKGSVSWTGKSVSYYLHTIDRRKLENYFHNMRNPKNKNIDENGKNRRSNNRMNNSNGNSNDSNSDDSSKSKDDSFFGPTTRRAWSEWVHSQHRDNNSNSNQSCGTAYTPSSETGYHSDSKTNQNQQQKSSSSRPGRTRKYSPGVTAMVRRATKNNSSRGRRTGRRRKDGKGRKSVNFNGLDLLHAQTVLSIKNNAGTRTEPAPGCVDQSLDEVRKTDSSPDLVDKLPSANKKQKSSRSPLTNSSNVNGETVNLSNLHPSCTNFTSISNSMPHEKHISPPSPSSSSSETSDSTSIYQYKPIDAEKMFTFESALDSFLARTKQEFINYFTHVHTPDGRLTLEKSIEDEKHRNLRLSSQIEILERSINNLLQKGVCLLKLRASELDIEVSDADDISNKARWIVGRNKELKQQVAVIEEQITKIDTINSHLAKNKSIEALISVMSQPRLTCKDPPERPFIGNFDSVGRTPSNIPSESNPSKINQSGLNQIGKPCEPPRKQPSIESRPTANFSDPQKCNNSNTHTLNPDLVGNVAKTSLDEKNSSSPQFTEPPHRVAQYEGRLQNLIVAALNETPASASPTTSDPKSKKENRKKSLPKVDPPPRPNKFFTRTGRERALANSVVTKTPVEDSSVLKNPKLSEYDAHQHFSSGNNKNHALLPIKDKFIRSSTTKTDSKSSVKISSSIPTSDSATSEEKKEPILLTFKIDRRDNSAIVTSPAISPDKSPTKSPKENEVGVKRKNSAVEVEKKKSRSPKYSAIVSEPGESEKRTPSLIIKLNTSQMPSVSSGNANSAQSSEKSENNESQLPSKNEKSIDVSNSKTSRSHGPVNSAHKLQASIHNSFEKLVKLAQPESQGNDETLSVTAASTAYKASSNKKKRSHKSAPENGNGRKSPSNTPPHTPSPSDSPARPLTPSTPPGFTPLPDTIVPNAVAENKRPIPELPLTVSHDRETPSSVSTETGSTVDSNEEVKVRRRVSRPPKKNVSMWMDTNSSEIIQQHQQLPTPQNNEIFNPTPYTTVPNPNERLGVVRIKKSSPMTHPSWRHPMPENMIAQNVPNGCHPLRSDLTPYGVHPSLQYSQDCSVIHNNPNFELLSNPGAKFFPYNPSLSTFNDKNSPSSVPMSLAPEMSAMTPDQRMCGLPPMNFPSYNPYHQEPNFKVQRKAIAEQELAGMAKCRSQNNLLRPSRLDTVCKRDYNTPIKQYT
ncbi:DOT1 like histone lysine methyltransferase grappa isoform X2 [Brevipalpus obovatus]|uniref:DOT1 like histone lysine methyltransferase grappa isoform X2 n=1 Tax=Brevipalpus obovatus TaxID=246614 RepID=UPI003D9E84B0